MNYKLLIILSLLLGAGQFCNAMEPSHEVFNEKERIDIRPSLSTILASLRTNKRPQGVAQVKNKDYQDGNYFSEKRNSKKHKKDHGDKSRVITISSDQAQGLMSIATPLISLLSAQTPNGQENEDMPGQELRDIEIDKNKTEIQTVSDLEYSLEGSEDLQEEIQPSKKQRIGEPELSDDVSFALNKQSIGSSAGITMPMATLKATAAPKLLRCSYCEETFFKSKEFVAHVKDVHQGERPFVCTVSNCNKSFSMQSILKQHEDSVHKKIRYTCGYPDCGKSFSARGSLKQHEDTVHKGIRYTCGYPGCDKSFSTQSSLKQHKDSAHKKIRYACSYCNMFFCSTKQYLNRHTTTKHPAAISSNQTPELTSIATPLISLLSMPTPNITLESEGQDGMLQDSIEQEKSQDGVAVPEYTDMQEIDNLIQFNDNNE